MRSFLLALGLSVSLFANDIIVKESSFNVTDTISNIKKIVEAKGFTVFAVINHQQNASNVGMYLNESKIIIFGNPKIGTLLMQEDMQVALDLPLRILVYLDANDKVKIAYRDGKWIKDHHFLQSENLTNKVNKGLNKITNKARLKVK
ncbi:MAG: hypothetical protein COA44_10770 [Arcobacter sp.]|nr:MAG: hypothetical protein COA44_10770 [Arcobacter sp.]